MMRDSLCRIGLLGLMVLAFTPITGQVCAADTARILCPDQKPQTPILLGIERLESVLKAQKWTVVKAFGPQQKPSVSTKLEIIVSPFDAKFHAGEGTELFRNVVGTKAESSALLVFPKADQLRVYVIGRDPVGTMYATFHAADCLAYTPPSMPLEQRIPEMKHTPSVSTRGIHLMLHRQALADPYSWFHSQVFWTAYLDILCRARFNYLELQGVFDLLSAELTNLLPYFMYLPEFKQVGVGIDEAPKNMASLKRIIELAHERGISVTLVNSAVSWNISGGQNPPAANDDLLRYTNQAIAFLMKECATLDGVGIQVSEAETKAEFFFDTYIKTLDALPHKPALFLRTGQSDLEQVKNLAGTYGGRSILEVKYNGDHLGLPYPVSGGRMSQWPAYSYQDVFNQPHRYGVLFQIQTAGTHRVFPWGDSHFIRSALRNTNLAGANGFVMQTHATYSPHVDMMTNSMQSDLRYYAWSYERDWYWYWLWGRLAYNTGEAEKVLIHGFEDRFGKAAGPLLYRALQHASQVIPAINNVCYLGPDKSHTAPEFEPPMDLAEALRVQPLDSFAIRSVSDEIHILSEGRTDSRRSPCDLLDDAVKGAAEGVRLAQLAGAHFNDSTKTQLTLKKEWNAWLIDFKTLAALSRYWRDQINAAVQVGFFQTTGDVPSLILASQNVQTAGEAWEEVRVLTEKHYRPFFEPFRIQASNFHWNHYTSRTDEDQKLIAQLYESWTNLKQLPSTGGHFRVTRSAPSQPILLTLSVPPSIELAQVFAKMQNSEGVTKDIPLEPARIAGVYYAEIPSSRVIPGVFRYFFSGATLDNQTVLVPSNRPPFTVAVTDDDEPPTISSLKHTVNSARNRVSVTAEFVDPAGIKSATILWKRFPSSESWQKTIMRSSGPVYSGVFPLTNEGAQFAVEAVDGLGNIRRIPDVKTETPFSIISPAGNE